MNLSSTTSALLGGLGLFLVGMWLMTDGLKLAAGNALREILHAWTNSPRRGLVTGFFITALVQSSSAVTVATIGFANSGLLTLEQSIWVIFGSNVGTTMTGWIVAILGFKINIEAFALPLIGIGMLIRLSGQMTRRGAIGQAIVGFGLFFLGIGVLKEAFEAVGAGVNLPGIETAGLSTLFLYVLLGLFLTTLMQSSSAAIVITLTAAEGGLIPLSAAAATVIGANLGTTSTAILSVWGATSTAKRVAASHVIFNLLTAFIALIIIIPMLATVHWLLDILNLPPAPATTLALFHSTFNILGVLLMWPLANRLVGFLETRFITEEELVGRPKYLDKTILEVPALAVTALMNELHRVNEISIHVATDAISIEDVDGHRISKDINNIDKLATEIGNYVAQLSRSRLSVNMAEALPEVILNVQQYATLVDIAGEIVEQQVNINIRQEQGKILESVTGLKQCAAHIMINAMPASPDFDLPALQQKLDKLGEIYDSLKLAVLQAGADGHLGMVTVDAQLQQANLIKRLAKQSVKEAARLQQIIEMLGIHASMNIKPQIA